MNLKILSWNIWCTECIKNADVILDEIKRFNPDIVCLQEVAETETKKTIDKILGSYNYGVFALADVVDGTKVQGNAILSKYEIISNKKFHITDRAESFGDYSKEGRVYLETQISANNKVITIGTTHASYTHKFAQTPEKDTEMQKLLSQIEKNKSNYIFAGDLNTTHTNSYISQIEKHLKNIAPPYSENTWTTKPFNYNGFSENNLNWRIDYMFGSKDIDVVSSQILQTEISDHLPILTEINF